MTRTSKTTRRSSPSHHRSACTGGRGITRRALLTAAVAAGLVGLVGCGAGPRGFPLPDRITVDPSLVEVPTGVELSPYPENLTRPVAMAFYDDGHLLVAEGAVEGGEPRIYGFTPALKRFEIYPLDKPVLPFSSRSFRLYGPIGGIRYHKGWLYVSHRDENDFGVITALDYKGGH